MEWNKEICIQLYDAISDQLNDSWPAFMEQAFHVPRDNGLIIKGGRELLLIEDCLLQRNVMQLTYLIWKASD